MHNTLLRAPRPAVKPAAGWRRFVLAAAFLAAAYSASPKSDAAAQENSGLGGSDAAAVTRFVETFVDQTVAVLTDKTLAPEQRDAAYRAFLLAGFDIDGGARFALGRGWRIATSEQRAEFVALFRVELLAKAKELFEGYQPGEVLEVRRVRPAGSGKFMAETKLTNPEARIDDVDFLVRKTGAEMQIVDVRLEGFSLRDAYRSRFVGPLFQGGVEQVLRQLRPAEAF